MGDPDQTSSILPAAKAPDELKPLDIAGWIRQEMHYPTRAMLLTALQQGLPGSSTV
jgi:hypothetical protein